MDGLPEVGMRPYQGPELRPHTGHPHHTRREWEHVHTRGKLHRFSAGPGQPQGWMRFLQGLWKYRHWRGNLDVLPLIGKRFLLRPRLQQHVQGLVEFLSGGAEIPPEASHFVRLIATSHATHKA